MAAGGYGSFLRVYDAAHRRRGTRLAHLVALPLMGAAVPVAFVSLRWSVATLAVGWALQYLSHVFIEGNDTCLKSWKQVPVAALWTVAQGQKTWDKIQGWTKRS